jgi:hypothetical protein
MSDTIPEVVTREAPRDIEVTIHNTFPLRPDMGTQKVLLGKPDGGEYWDLLTNPEG